MGYWAWDGIWTKLTIIKHSAVALDSNLGRKKTSCHNVRADSRRVRSEMRWDIWQLSLQVAGGRTDFCDFSEREHFFLQGFFAFTCLVSLVIFLRVMDRAGLEREKYLIVLKRMGSHTQPSLVSWRCYVQGALLGAVGDVQVNDMQMGSAPKNSVRPRFLLR